MRRSIALLCLAIAIGAAAQQPTPAPEPAGFSAADLRDAREFAQNSGLPPSATGQMQQLLEQADRWQHSSAPKQPPDMQSVIPFLVNWIEQSRKLPPARQAGALYAADILLGLVPLYIEPQTGRVPSRAAIDQNTASLRAQLAGVGAHFAYDELGATYAYARDWIQEAFRIAPESQAGQRAFLFLLNTSFQPGCCCSGEGFKDVISRAPQILKQHPHRAIGPEVLLAIGDAYRDIVAVANGAYDPFAEAVEYKPQEPHARREALRYYHAAIAAAPHSDAAKEALRKARDLQAGIAPRDLRFICLYD